MQELDTYLRAKREIFSYFSYEEDWAVIPIDDRRDYFWRCDGDGPGEVWYGATPETVDTYKDDIYTQRFLSKWVYRQPEFTMICVDTHTDGNKFLAIFTNSKEVKVDA